MTISSTTRRAGPFTGNGVATVFPFGFKIFDKTNVKVLLTAVSGALTTLVLDSDYSVTLNADQNNNPGGSITYPLAGNPMLSGFSLLVLGNLAISQPTDITNSGGFYPKIIEDMVDRATIQIQQLATDQSLSLSFPENEAISGLLPAAGSRANTLLAFDSNGRPTAQPITASVGAGVMTAEGPFQAGINFVAGTTTALQLSQAYGQAANVQVHFDGVYQGPDQYQLFGTQIVFNSPIPAGTTTVYIVGGTSLSIYLPVDGETVPAGTKMYNRINDFCSVKDFGAKGDGAADDTAAIQAALNSAYDVFLPAGKYLVRGLHVPAHVKFHGMNPINSGFFQDLTHGSWLYCVDLVNPALSLDSACTVEQMSFFYPNQVTDLIGAATPVVYPPTLKLTEGNADTMVRNCMFMNPYILLDASTPVSSHSSLWMSDIYGYPLYRGIILDNGIDVDRLDRCMFSLKYYPQSGSGLQTWVNNNAWAFYIKRADTGRATDCFAYGYYYGAINEGTNVFTWLNCAFDCVIYDALIDGTSFGISYIGCGFVARPLQAPTVPTDAITVNAPSVDFTVQGCRFWGVSGHAIHVLACTSGVVNGNTFSGFGGLANAANLKGALFLEGGSGNNIDFTGNVANCADSAFSTSIYCYQNAGGLVATGNTIKNAADAAAVFTLGSSNFQFANNNLRNSAAVLDLSGAINKIVTPNLSF